MKYYIFFLLMLSSVNSNCLNDCSKHGDCIWIRDRGSPGSSGSSNSSSFLNNFTCKCDLGYKGLACNETYPIHSHNNSKEEEEVLSEEKNLLESIAVEALIGYILGIIGSLIIIVEMIMYLRKRRSRKRSLALHNELRYMNPREHQHQDPYRNIHV